MRLPDDLHPSGFNIKAIFGSAQVNRCARHIREYDKLIAKFEIMGWPSVCKIDIGSGH